MCVHQIQSGQVIVDLCSVAKELVENSLDAGATTIEVRFKNNGLDLIEVQDNGSGISPENYENVALKHYTSKLSSYDDLSSLHTFGFRGEALSSLCALADFHIITAQANQVPRANRLDFEISGKLRKTQVVAGQKGTTASVEGIFKRLPVRRRELEKNIKREYGKVLNLLHAYACISAGVKFNVRNTVGKTKNVVVFSTNGNRTTKENIANVYGAKTLSALIPLDLELEFEPSAHMRRSGGGGGGGEEQSNQLVVRGHISRPVFGEGRQTPDRQMFFVNSRPCGLPQIAKALNEVYKSFNVSQSPFIFADFQMDTNAYDVNVSPDKRTILLHDAAALIESLKTSLVQLFEAADQTVPQSQAIGLKDLTKPKQQALGLVPGFVTARQAIQDSPEPVPTPDLGQDVDNSEKESADSQRTMQNSIKRFTSNRGESVEVETLRTPINSTPKSQQPPMPSHVEPPSTGPDDETGDRSEPVLEHEMDGETARPLRRPSSPPADPGSVPSQSPDESEETSNVVQNAFDRMRPRRMPAEMATITIGDHTVTSIVGSGRPRKRSSDAGHSSHGPTKRKRRIHTPSRPNIFGVQMKAFAAPGTQMDEDERDEEEPGSEDDASNTSEDGYIDEEAEEAPEGEEGEEAYSPEPDNTEYVPEGNRESPDGAAENEQRPIEEASTVDTDETTLDEAEKKAQEEAMVQRLIHQAEERAVLPSEHNTSRANKLNKGAAHRDATVQLVTTMDGSVSKLRMQMATLRESLQTRKVSSHKADPDLGDEKAAEDRLSLTVSKADFAQMRIIGQFNLGFIIAVRPGEDHDELFIIDQHASDEKFNFERLQAETVVQNQRLVRPQRLDLTAVEEEIVLENRAALEKNGFIVTVDESGDEPIGRRCQLVSLPLSKEVVFGSRDLEELIVLLSEAPGMSGISVPRPSKVRKMFAMRACRSSIMIGKTLTTRQMQRVVRNMGTIDKPWNCPHGRPTMRHLMSLGQWEGWDEYINETASTAGEEEGDEGERETGGEISGGMEVWRRYVEEAEQEEEHEDDEED
ncbi:Mismatch repair endonuclease PMS2 [Penicillium rolfsii]|nr:Mismatch repair endonuclease PMS2 [Penicillium rolfsii]